MIVMMMMMIMMTCSATRVTTPSLPGPSQPRLTRYLLYYYKWIRLFVHQSVCPSVCLIFVVQEAEEEAKHSSSKKRVTTVVQG